MDGLSIDFHGCRMQALGSGALFWPDTDTLILGDLHLGRAARSALRGGALLPPYEGRDTLSRLAADLAATAAGRVICLGDSLDDGATAPDAETAAMLAALASGRDWVWVAGNHDPGPPPIPLPGARALHHLAEISMAPLVFRHIPAVGAAGEVSAHLHPTLTLRLGRERVRRPCFLIDDQRLMLPAYGSYTGGLDCTDPAFAPYFGPSARALLLPAERAGSPFAFSAARATSSGQRARSTPA